MRPLSPRTTLEEVSFRTLLEEVSFRTLGPWGLSGAGTHGVYSHQGCICISKTGKTQVLESLAKGLDAF